MYNMYYYYITTNIITEKLWLQLFTQFWAKTFKLLNHMHTHCAYVLAIKYFLAQVL